MEYIQELIRFWQGKGFRGYNDSGRICLIREDRSETALVVIIPERLPGQPEVSIKELETALAGTEQMLMIKTGKKVNRLTLVLCSDLPDEKTLGQAKEYPDIWWLDQKNARLLVFENQRTDFLGMREELLDFALQSKAQKQKESHLELKNMLQPVTVAIALLNILVFLVISLLGDSEDSDLMLRFGAMSWEAVMEKGQYYRLITAMFLHFGPQHLIQNMLVLMLVGTRMESALGKVRYLLVYMGAGLIASLSSVFFTLRGSYDIAAGASGAIFGIMGGLLYLIIRDSAVKSRRYIREIGLAGVIFMVGCAVSYGFFESGIDNAAHLGGLAGGFVLTALAALSHKG